MILDAWIPLHKELFDIIAEEAEFHFNKEDILSIRIELNTQNENVLGPVYIVFKYEHAFELPMESKTSERLYLDIKNLFELDLL